MLVIPLERGIHIRHSRAGGHPVSLKNILDSLFPGNDKILVVASGLLRPSMAFALRAVLCTSDFAPGEIVELRSHPLATRIEEANYLGSREWIRTTDPHHVKVVL